MFAAILAFFSSPGRQALGWALLGIIGIGLAGGGALLLLTGGDGDGGTPSVGDSLATAQAQASAPGSASASTTGTSGSPTTTPTRIGLTATAFALEQQSLTQTATSGTPTPSATTAQTPVPTPTTGFFPTATASAPEPTATTAPPTPTTAPAGTFCGSFSTGGVPTFPVQVSGNITRNGAPAGAGLSVSLAFDGIVGMSLVTTAESSFNFRFPVNNSPGCVNRFGAGLTVIVDGQSFGAGSVSQEPFLLVNVAIN